ncbi:MAG: Ppx/GppA phosphatase [Bacteroidetes bacterium]|nr:MAG: Ppx/GppA phosphatase [Bacteroidota bacterium]
MKFAAIDIGSNAVRLLFGNVYEGKNGPSFKKADLVRVPLRLGEDAFLRRKITPEKIEKLLMVMRAFRNLIDFYAPAGVRACATAAIREAVNGADIVARIKKETGLNVEIIDGKTEAKVIYSNHVAELLDVSSDYLYVDVGGGSTEVTLFSKNEIIASRSFNIGTIRMLNDLVSKDLWSEFKDWVKETTKDHKRPLSAIGSGGNINKIFKMSRKKQNRPLAYGKLKEMYEFLDAFTLDERIKILGLNPDRADVIIPAVKIFLTVMKIGEIDRIFVPQIGMADGLIHLLYEEHKAKLQHTIQD